MIKESNYIYLHTLDNQDILYGISKGVHRVYIDENGDAYIWLKSIRGRRYFIYRNQYIILLPNKINKLLYKELK